MSDLVIETKDLRKWFGKPDEKDKKGRPKGVKAVDGVDLQIRRGEIFGLLGPNGAGKTTCLSMLVTIHPPTSGVAKVAGIDVKRDPAQVRRHVGIVFQEPTLDTLLTARENLHLHGRLYGVPARDLKPRTDEMLRLVGLTDRADDQVKKFSGGMKRRLEIARGLMHQPEVLFLDEPTLGLDPATREHIWDYIRQLRDEHGTTCVLTTHYMEYGGVFPKLVQPVLPSSCRVSSSFNVASFRTGQVAASA
jgi:ABC-2 type transport system ATP-binding protein